MAEVIVSSRGYLTQEIVAGRHRLVADEPVEEGGSDLGPDPYVYLLAALGACTSMTIQMYARRKLWPLEQVEVSLRNRRVYAEDCDHCEEKDRQIHRIERYISLTGPLDEAQRARLLEIAQLCPVHKTLTSRIEIVDFLD